VSKNRKRIVPLWHDDDDKRKHLTPSWREEQLDALRDGRKNRSSRFRSAKDYRRKPKHGKHHDA